MGEAQAWLFEPEFNRAVKVSASDERITSDAGFLLLREADHRLGLTESLANQLHDPRRQDLIRYQLVELLRERIYALAQGYSAQDDADRLAHDPAMKIAAWDRPGEQPLDERLASQPSQSRRVWHWWTNVHKCGTGFASALLGSVQSWICRHDSASSYR